MGPRYSWSAGKRKTQRIENPLKVGNSDLKKYCEYELRRIGEKFTVHYENKNLR